MTYLLGAHSYLPPLVSWGSVGYFLSNFIHLTAFFKCDDIFGFNIGNYTIYILLFYYMYSLFII